VFSLSSALEIVAFCEFSGVFCIYKVGFLFLLQSFLLCYNELIHFLCMFIISVYAQYNSIIWHPWEQWDWLVGLTKVLVFNPSPNVISVMFDRTLSFGLHVHYLCPKFFPRFKALRSIASASWCPSKESLSQLYKALILPVLLYTSPGWFSFLCLKVYHRSAC